MKKKIIVYGLGKAYENAKTFLKEEFDLLAYSDKEWKELYERTKGRQDEGAC